MTAETENREVGILFRDEMVRAIRAGVKVETRRIVDPQPIYFPHDGKLSFADRHSHPNWDGERGIRPPYEECDVLYVREAWRLRSFWPGEPPTIEFRAGGWTEPMPMTAEEDERYIDWSARIVESTEAELREKGIEPDENGEWFWGPREKNPLRWRPSIHLPRYCSRLWLRVLDVRVERLDEIDDEGALAEGVAGTPTVDTDIDGDWYPGRPRARFRELWESIHGTWDPSVYVWVVRFDSLGRRP